MKTKFNKIKNKTSLILAVIGTLLIGAGAYGAWAFTSPTAAPTNDGNMKSLSQLAAMINPAASCINNSYTTPASFAQGSDNYPSLYGLYTALPAGGCNTGAVSNPCVNMGNGAISGFTNPAAAPANTNYSFKSLYNKIGGDPTTSEPINPSSGIGTNDFYTLNALETRINSVVSTHGYDTCNEYCGDSTVNGGETCDGQANCTSCACDSGYTWSGSECQGGVSCVWGTKLNSDQEKITLAQDSNGLYVAGYMVGGPNVFGGTCDNLTADGTDAYVAKYDLSGNCVWNKQIGGTSSERPRGSFVDSGYLYLAGEYSGSISLDGCTLPNTIGATDYSGFIAKLNISDDPASGKGKCVWAKKMGNTSTTDNERANDIIVNSNNVFVTGWVEGANGFDPPCNPGTAKGNEDIFVAKYDLNGNCQWAKRAGGTGQDVGGAITANPNGVSITGGFYSSNSSFGTCPSCNLTLAGGSINSFVAKYDLNGNEQWAKNLGEEIMILEEEIGSDSSNNLYLSLLYRNSITIDSCPTQTAQTTGGDLLTKLDGSSGTCIWATTIEVGSSYGGSILIRNGDGLYIGDDFGGPFSTTASFNTCEDITASSSSNDTFLAKYNLDTGNCVWAKNAGGTPNSDHLWDMSVDSDNIYVLNSLSFGATNDLDCVANSPSSSYLLKYTK